MSQLKRQSKLLGLLEDSDPDEISDSLISFSSLAPAGASKMPTPKKARGRPAANKVTKPAQTSTGRSSGRLAVVATAVAREALLDKSTNQAATKTTKHCKSAKEDDAVANDAVDDMTDTEPKPAVGRPRGRPPKAKNATSTAANPSLIKHAPARGGRRAKKEASPSDLSEIPETQDVVAMDMDNDDEQEEKDEENEMMNLSPEHQPPTPAQHTVRALSLSPRKRLASSPGRDASSAQLRRRIGDLNNRCESLETKYRDLREIGVKEAERNFDRLQKQSEERARAANILISDLRADLEVQRGLAKEGQLDKTRLRQSEDKVADLNVSLAEARKEIKTLSAKLSASRSADVSVARIPGSVVKGGHVPSAQATSSGVSQMKDDLYADLTGLIVRNIRRESTEDIFDCLQTGRNGTLHFKLCVENEETSESYEDAQFTYMPQLDESRDRELVGLLPDFLTDEITFPRPQAAKFYARVSKSLTEMPE